MTTIHAGATLERPPGPTYLERLHFAEITVPEPVPKPATMGRWASSIEGEITLSLVVPRAAIVGAAGPLRFDDAMEDALSRCIEGAEALGARFVVLPTGGAVTTGQRDRDLIAAWLERWPASERRRLVWHPTGLWDPEIAAPFARRLGVMHAIDPLEHEIPAGAPQLYARLRAIGLRSRFSETLLLEALDAIEQASVEEAWVAIDSPKSFREAVRMTELAG